MDFNTEGGVACRAIGNSAAVADGQNESLLGLFNKSTSPIILKVHRILLMSGSLSAVTGVGINVNIRRITALSAAGGAAAGVLTLNPNQSLDNITPHITAYISSSTITAGSVLAYRAVNNDEIALTGQSDHAYRVLWEAWDRDNRIILPKGHGIDIFQVTSSTAGAWIPEIEFSVHGV